MKNNGRNTIMDSSRARIQQLSVNMNIGNKVSTSQRSNGTFRTAMNAPNNKTRVYDSSDYTRFLKNKNVFRRSRQEALQYITNWIQLGLDIDGEAASDPSAKSVTLSSDGTIIAIGADSSNGINGAASGHVRVYQYSNDSWSQLGQDIGGESVGDQSGESVSLSSNGSIVAIGARYNTENGSDSGHVRVYQYSNDSWTQLGQDINGEAVGDQSGGSVTLSSDGTIVAIGANKNEGNGTASGHVRVYKYDVNKTTSITDQSSIDFGPVGWRRLGQDIDGETIYDYSGNSVSLSSDGTIVAIGANKNDNIGEFNSGHVRVYQYNGTVWTQLGQDIDGESADDDSGYSVSLSSDGTIVAIGAIGDDGNGVDSGHVRVYKYDVNKTTSITDQSSIDFGPVGWRRLGQDIDGEAGDKLGHSVSLSSNGTIVAIGAIGNDGNGVNSGHVRVYQYNGTVWTKIGEDINGEAANDQSGYSVSLSSDGTIVAIGVYLNDVRVYKLTTYSEPAP